VHDCISPGLIAEFGFNAHISQQHRRDKMKPNFKEKFFAALTMFEGAREAATAVRNHRKPSAAALRKLGLDPNSFDKIDL
jgi:hypothetical protein